MPIHGHGKVVICGSVATSEGSTEIGRRENRSGRLTRPEDALERMREAAEPFREAIATDGSVPNIENDGLKWWQRLGMQLAEKARDFAIALAEKVLGFWRSREDEQNPQPDQNDRGIDR